MAEAGTPRGDGVFGYDGELSVISGCNADGSFKYNGGLVIGTDDNLDAESKHRAWLMTMDYVQKFDVELDKDVYYAGEVVTGKINVVTTENIKVKGIRLTLRGKAHTEWRVNKAGERRTVKDDEYYIDEKKIIWGKDKHEEAGILPILPRGKHVHTFEFKLPETALPCSFESKIGTIRYYMRMVMDIPYASPPQGIKYFTLVGPHIDCMDDSFLAPKYAEDKYRTCCFCCAKGTVNMQATLERSAYCCGENIRLKTEIQNSSVEPVWLLCKFMQKVEYYMTKGVLGLVKSVSHKVWEYEADRVRPHHTARQDKLQEILQVPVAPPTCVDVCNLMNISYTLKLYVIGESSAEIINVDFPITIGTVPFRIPNGPAPVLQYEHADSSVEGGMYVSSEFQLGQVYMGDESQDTDDVIIYKPLYVCVPHEKRRVTNTQTSDVPSRSSAQVISEVSENQSIVQQTEIKLAESCSRKFSEPYNRKLFEPCDRKLSEPCVLKMVEPCERKLLDSPDLKLMEPCDLKLAEQHDLKLAESCDEKLVVSCDKKTEADS